MHAGGLFMVTFRRHLARNAVWVRGDFELSFEFSFHHTLLLLLLLLLLSEFLTPQL
jgi:hypothetical protein